MSRDFVRGETSRPGFHAHSETAEMMSALASSRTSPDLKAVVRRSFTTTNTGVAVECHPLPEKSIVSTCRHHTSKRPLSNNCLFCMI
jgi:hypothetical protein